VFTAAAMLLLAQTGPHGSRDRQGAVAFGTVEIHHKNSSKFFLKILDKKISNC
jgi:hypothetical protein